jgi:UDP-glucose 4-epimerase
VDRLKVVVTGGGGKLARHLLPELISKHEVVLFDKQPPDQDPSLFTQGEITDLNKLNQVFRGAKVVIHLAALRSIYNHLPMEVMETNTSGTFCVLEAAQRAKVAKIIFSSSDTVLGMAQSKNEFPPEYLPVDEQHALKPQDPYGISKFLGESMCRCYAAGFSINIIALRFSNILCPGDEKKYSDDAKDPSTRRKSLWAWVHVDDAVQAIMRALDSELQGYDVFHIAADDVCLLNFNVKDLLRKYFPTTSIRRPLLNKEGLIDCSKAKQMLGFKISRRFEEVMPERV